MVLDQAFLSEKCSSRMRISCASFTDRIISLLCLMSFRRILSQVVFGLPAGLFTAVVYTFRASLAGVLDGKRKRCPNHFSLLLDTVLLQDSVDVLSYKSSFLMILGQRTCMVYNMFFLRSHASRSHTHRKKKSA